MINFLSNILPILVLISHIAFVFLILVLLIKNDLARNIGAWLGKHAIALSFFVSAGAVLWSLFYSNILGFSPCVLCWWQRVFLYPISLITAIGLYKKDEGVMKYVVVLATLSGIIALYQAYANFGGASILPCTAQGGECSRIYVMAFGYITIPVMSLTVSLYLIILSRFKKLYA